MPDADLPQTIPPDGERPYRDFTNDMLIRLWTEKSTPKLMEEIRIREQEICYEIEMRKGNRS